MDTNDARAQQLAKDIRDAKRAPEIAAWLRLGPLPIRDIIEMRRERMLEDGMDASLAETYAAASVMHDLGRVAGIGGAVEYRDGLLWLNAAQRDLVDSWVREDAFRRVAIAPEAEPLSGRP